MTRSEMQSRRNETYSHTFTFSNDCQHSISTVQKNTDNALKVLRQWTPEIRHLSVIHVETETLFCD